MILKILAFIFLVPGFLMVFGAKMIVAKFNLNKNVKCEFEHQMSEEELEQYKVNKAVVDLKMLGMLVALPGLILVIVAFK